MELRLIRNRSLTDSGFCGRREKLGHAVEQEIRAHGGEATYIRADARVALFTWRQRDSLGWGWQESAQCSADRGSIAGRGRLEAKHAKPIVVGQLRPGKAHSGSLGFLRISCQASWRRQNLVRLSSKKAAYVAVGWCRV
jgi:hypothetical protein